MDPRTLLIGALLCGACTPATAPAPAPTVVPDEAPRVWNMRVFGTAASEETDFERMLDALAESEFVLVGETHTDDQTHRLEAAIVEGLAARKEGKIALSLEMFERDVQPKVDAYLSDTIDEAEFLQSSRPWHNYRTGYRPMVEAAKKAGVPVVAANLPGEIRMKVAMKGKAGLDELSAEQKAWLPAEIHPPTRSYWARMEKRLRDAGHGMGGHADAQARRYSVQNLWDNTMAEACLQAQTEGTTVVHVAGAFHVEYGDGIAAQIRRRRPEAKIAIVTFVPVDDLRLDEPLREVKRADFIVYALADAQGPNAGRLSVATPADLRFRLSAPRLGTEPRPLLVWLEGAGGSTNAAMQMLSLSLGSDVIVAVVEPPYREVGPDLAVTGRWAWADTYAADQGRIVDGVERIVAYLSDRWVIDPEHVVVAGVGAGGASALWTGLYGSLEGANIVAIQPDGLQRLGEAGLPTRRPPAAEAFVIANAKNMEKAKATLDLARLKTRVEPPRMHEVRLQAEVALRAALGLEPRPAVEGEPIRVALAASTPLAWQWGMLHARVRERDDKVRVQVVPPGTEDAEPLAVRPEDFEDGMALPLAPGPFGGTTILVLPRGLKAKAKAPWLVLQEKDVISARSRFAHVKVVDDAGLPAALDAIRDAGKRNVLIVPAVFAADPPRMQELKAKIQGHDHDLDLNWLPGLGGELARVRAQ